MKQIEKTTSKHSDPGPMTHTLSYMSYITNKVWSLFLHPFPIKNEVKTNSILKDKQPRLMGVCTLVYVSGQIVGKKSLNFNCFGGFWRGFILLFTTISKVTNPWEEVVMVCARYIYIYTYMIYLIHVFNTRFSKSF